MKPRAYSYLRFSTPEQMKGDSFRRQSQMAIDYCARNGLTLDTELTFRDLGVSAYRGKNAERGALAAFKDAVENGQVPQGSILLVEGLDRVSRTKPRKAVKILEAICEAGVGVLTMSDGKLYTEDTLDNDPFALIMSVLIFIRANEESATKAKRLRASWDERRKQLQENSKPLLTRPPSWIKIDPVTKEFSIIEEKAEVVRRIFALAASGAGYYRIIETLESEGVPTMAKHGEHWRYSSVRNILTSRAVIGEYQPHIIEHVDGKKTRKPTGSPIKMYPPIVSEALFEEVQALRDNPEHPSMRAKRHFKTNGKGLRNIFSGMVVCSRCGSAMSKQFKSPRKGVMYHYLVCVEARYGRGCKYTGVPYENVESGFMRDLDLILAMGPKTTSSTLEKDLKSTEAAMWAIEEKIEKLSKAYTRVPDEAILRRLQECRGELTVLKERERQFTADMVNTSGPLVVKRIAALREALGAQPKDVERINACLQALFTGVALNPDTGVATLGWRGGGESTFLFGFPPPERT